MVSRFGKHVRAARRKLALSDAKRFSVTAVARRVKLDRAYYAKVESGREKPPSEDKIAAIARELGENVDVLLALAGKVRGELLAIILARPRIVPLLLEQVRDVPDDRLLRTIRDGSW